MENKDLRVLQHREAINRMKTLRMRKEVISEFERSGQVRICTRPHGNYILPTETEMAGIQEFDRQHNATTYVVLRAITMYGVMDAYFYVSGECDKWEIERNDLNKGLVMCYVVNHDNPECSEFGDISFKHTRSRGLVRTDIDFF